MNAEQNQANWGFAARWMAITALTFMIALAIAYTSMRPLSGIFRTLGEPGPQIATGVWVGGLIGLGLGVGQAIALRSKDIATTRWVLYTVFGGMVAHTLYTVLSGQIESASRTWFALFAGSMLGLCIGTAQWLLLKVRLSNAALWIPTTVVAFIVAAWVAFQLLDDGREWFVLAAMGLVAGGITGLGAVWLFDRVRPAVAGQLGLLLIVLVMAGCGGNTEPTVRFAEPRDGASVAAPVRVVMAAENFTVEPAGDGTVHDGAGHLHIMVDTPCVDAGQTIPKDDTHLHFGDGSTETELALSPGEHTLCLQAADGAHTALPGEGMTHSISITVP